MVFALITVNVPKYCMCSVLNNSTRYSPGSFVMQISQFHYTLKHPSNSRGYTQKWLAGSPLSIVDNLIINMRHEIKNGALS